MSHAVEGECDIVNMLSLLNYADTAAHYLESRFNHYVSLGDGVATTGPLPPLSLTTHLVADCEHLAKIAARAYKNRGKNFHSTCIQNDLRHSSSFGILGRGTVLSSAKP